ncbi:hypothetical protein KP806_04960 [Paenibacillus sp. N4]|uniref:sporulation protein YpjB n=1 Tax=Paenibacillus vietnamensis TaxID=2590547 RepID=UPI001CD10DEC|nr:sporulation protein YpjB [Paenibacillus vietnamensis]MCA0754389.1 hypothetical protein [Paenibacillus vietnamensis]
MKLRIIIPFVICIVMTIGSAGAVWGSSFDAGPNADVTAMNLQSELSRLDELAGSLYHAANINNRQAGYAYLQQLQRLLEGGQRPGGMNEGWEFMKLDSDAIGRALVSGDAAAGWTREAARLRLAADALVRPDHALWLQYESLMLDDLSRVEKAWKRQTGDGAEAARAALGSLQSHADRIEPAVAILFGSMHAAELKGRIRYTNQLLESGTMSPSSEHLVNQSLKSLNASVIRLFDRSGSVEVEPAVAPIAAANPIKWTLMLGAVISAVLTYTGWRKYKAEPYGVKPIT